MKQHYPPTHKPDELVGIGLRYPYYEEVLETELNLGWLEIHPENYFGGGVHRHFLSKARENFQISFHSVGLSLGSTQAVAQEHLKQIKELIDIFDPFHVSDHASWSASGNAHLNDLLPLPYTQESLDQLSRNVMQTQDYFDRQILVENPSTYVAFKGNEMSEAAFMNTLADRTGCKILLDINNIYVQSVNHGFDPYTYIDDINGDHVGEIHLAGHIEKDIDGQRLLIDTHNQPVCADVWDLYAHAIRKLGPIHTLIEWDQGFPSLSELVAHADQARDAIRKETAAEKSNVA